MQGNITIECHACTEDITVPVALGTFAKVKNGREIRDDMVAAGWHVGRNCLCPDCLAKLDKSKTCGKCPNWRNGGGYTPYCGKDGEPALENDTCKLFGED